jgi:transcriptional regulator of acetoin/glycerol metabolism
VITGRKPKLSGEQARSFLEWAAFATSMGQAAKRLGVARTTLHRYLRGQHKRRVYG